MCGIAGIIKNTEAAVPEIYNALIMLQHRGQDAAGIVSSDFEQMHIHKGIGMVRDVFLAEHMQELQGTMAIGHVRYPTQGTAKDLNPVVANAPFGIALSHNGNVINTKELQELLRDKYCRLMMSNSDSELLVNLFSCLMQDQLAKKIIKTVDEQIVFEVVEEFNSLVVGAYSLIIMIHGFGLLALRDPMGIRPLSMGSKPSSIGRNDYIFSSESAAMAVLEYTFDSDVKAGEAVLITSSGEIHRKICSSNVQHRSCIFEWIYLARPDSVLDGASVYLARRKMGVHLAQKMKKENLVSGDIDVVIPVPECSTTSAAALADELQLPYREGFVKNRYIGRTFIMPDQTTRKQSVKQKLNAIEEIFKNKSVLLVDDSIVRGTTSMLIVQMAKQAGAKKVTFASASPPVKYPNIFGIDTPTKTELIAGNFAEIDQIRDHIQADGLIYQDLADLKASVNEARPSMSTDFELCMFDGSYHFDQVNDKFWENWENMRNKHRKRQYNILGTI